MRERKREREGGMEGGRDGWREGGRERARLKLSHLQVKCVLGVKHESLLDSRPYR